MPFRAFLVDQLKDEKKGYKEINQQTIIDILLTNGLSIRFVHLSSFKATKEALIYQT